MTRLAIGVDVGGTKLAFLLTNQQGETLARYHLPTLAAEGSEAIINRIALGLQELLTQAPTYGEVVGIGLGTPGIVDSAAGVVRYAVNMGWNNVPLRDELARRLGLDVPIFLEKDANAGALGERYYGAARGCDDFVYIAVGTGLGGGIVSGGKLIAGVNYNPTEIGHTSLDPDGRECVCGMRGCPEIYVSGVGILAGIRAHRPQFAETILAEDATTVDILAAARAHDALAVTVMDEAAQWLGAVMACCAGIVNPARIIVAGGLGYAAADLLMEKAQVELKRRVLPMTLDGLTVQLGEVNDSTLGAASLVWHGLGVAE